MQLIYGRLSVQNRCVIQLIIIEDMTELKTAGYLHKT